MSKDSLSVDLRRLKCQGPRCQSFWIIFNTTGSPLIIFTGQLSALAPNLGDIKSARPPPLRAYRFTQINRNFTELWTQIAEHRH